MIESIICSERNLIANIAERRWSDCQTSRHRGECDVYWWIYAQTIFFRIEMMFFSYTSCATFSLINMLGFQFNERINMRLMILTRYLWFICPIQVLDLTNCEGHEAFETTVQFRVSCQFIGDDSAWKQSAPDHTIPNSVHRRLFSTNQ